MNTSKHFLFAGASSAMALATAHQLIAKGHIVTALTTKDINGDYSVIHRVQGYQSEHLPDLSATFDGLVYFPGNINLKPFHRIKQSEFVADYDLHALGAVSFIQKYLPLCNMQGETSASIVLISSVAARLGMPFHASVSMAKGALEGLTKSLAAELAPKIRVNAVAPSLVNTPLADRFINTPDKRESMEKRNPMKMVGEASDIAAMIGFLLSDDSKWITGQVLAVDGGMNSLKI